MGGFIVSDEDICSLSVLIPSAYVSIRDTKPWHVLCTLMITGELPFPPGLEARRPRHV